MPKPVRTSSFRFVEGTREPIWRVHAKSIRGVVVHANGVVDLVNLDLDAAIPVLAEESSGFRGVVVYGLTGKIRTVPVVMVTERLFVRPRGRFLGCNDVTGQTLEGSVLSGGHLGCCAGVLDTHDLVGAEAGDGSDLGLDDAEIREPGDGGPDVGNRGGSGSSSARTVLTLRTKSRRMATIFAAVAAMRAASPACVGASAVPKLKTDAMPPTTWMPAVHASSSPNSCSTRE